MFLESWIMGKSMDITCQLNYISENIIMKVEIKISVIKKKKITSGNYNAVVIVTVWMTFFNSIPYPMWQIVVTIL